MATTEEKQEFIQKVWEAIAGMDLQGLFPSVLIAQAALESNWGKSQLAAKYNNYFGIKALGNWRGKTVNMKTGEVLGGQKTTINSNFRVYDSLVDSITDRNRFLRQNPRYTRAGVFQASTPQEQAEALKRAGYATGTNYVSSIMSTINSNDLTKYDKLKKKL